MKYLQKLKTIFVFDELHHNYFLILLFIISLIYFINEALYYLLLINLIILILSFIKKKKLFFLLITLTIYLSTFLIINKINMNLSQYGNVEIKMQIYKTSNKDNKQTLYLKWHNKHFVTTSYDTNFISGDYVIITGTVIKPNGPATPGGFDYQKYLGHNKINGKIELDDIIFIKHGFSINRLHEIINEYISKNFDASYNGVIAALTIGEKNNMNNELSESISMLGISHLFVISGLHIDVLTKILKWLFKKLKEGLKNTLILVILLSYFIITSLMVSVLRVIISFVIASIFNKYLSRLTAFDKICMNAGIVLLINPLYLYSYSYLLSYAVVFGIILLQPFLKKMKKYKKLKSNILISLFALLFTLPITVKLGTGLNILTIIYNLLFIPFVSYVLMPLSFLTLFIIPLKYIYGVIYSIFFKATSVLSCIKILNLNFSSMSIVFCILYYLILGLIFVNNKKIRNIALASIMIFLFFWQVNLKLDFKDEIHFLSLPVGEATLIKEAHDKNNILIDTGDLDAEEIVSYLKRKGIKRLDYIIISHGDSDHIGGLFTIMDEFKVKNIFLSYYDESSHKALEKYTFKDTNVRYLRGGDELQLKDVYLKIIYPDKSYDSSNNNSLVFYLNFQKLNILFTGDLEIEGEAVIIPMIKNLQVDILKVGHHGSKTSSSLDFIKAVSPKIAVAMNGYYNKFGFPHKAVIDRFNELNIMIYNTIYMGTISLIRTPYTNNFKISNSYG